MAHAKGVTACFNKSVADHGAATSSNLQQLKGIAGMACAR